MAQPFLEPRKHRDVIGQQEDADQEGQNTLSGRDQHDDSHDDTQPAERVLEHQPGMR